jgi:hypothetical protein
VAALDQLKARAHGGRRTGPLLRCQLQPVQGEPVGAGDQAGELLRDSHLTFLHPGVERHLRDPREPIDRFLVAADPDVEHRAAALVLDDDLIRLKLGHLPREELLFSPNSNGRTS